jgi:small-conductance mechanosensitive channel
MKLFGVPLLGFDEATGKKLLFTLVLVVAYVVLRRVLRVATKAVLPPAKAKRISFWTRQVISVALFVLLALALVSIWFDNGTRLATVAGLFTAGVAFALQRVITAFAAYLVILRGSTFSVGDRIVMGGVRGDVIALDPFQTTIMEMGEGPGEQSDPPSLWVHGRQFTGRIVTVNNGVIFEQPLYNYTRDFPYIWDEIMIPIPYDGDDKRAEQILLEAAHRHAVSAESIAQDRKIRLEERFGLAMPEIAPRTYYALTDNWIAISLRFLVHTHSARRVKDQMQRDILAAFREAGIGIASGTYAIVQVPALTIQPPGPNGSLSALQDEGRTEPERGQHAEYREDGRDDEPDENSRHRERRPKR